MQWRPCPGEGEEIHRKYTEAVCSGGRVRGRERKYTGNTRRLCAVAAVFGGGRGNTQEIHGGCVQWRPCPRGGRGNTQEIHGDCVQWRPCPGEGEEIHRKYTEAVCSGGHVRGRERKYTGNTRRLCAVAAVSGGGRGNTQEIHGGCVQWRPCSVEGEEIHRKYTEAVCSGGRVRWRERKYTGNTRRLCAVAAVSEGGRGSTQEIHGGCVQWRPCPGE